jgi:hypothetical protein
MAEEEEMSTSRHRANVDSDAARLKKKYHMGEVAKTLTLPEQIKQNNKVAPAQAGITPEVQQIMSEAKLAPVKYPSFAKKMPFASERKVR